MKSRAFQLSEAMLLQAEATGNLGWTVDNERRVRQVFLRIPL